MKALKKLLLLAVILGVVMSNARVVYAGDMWEILGKKEQKVCRDLWGYLITNGYSEYAAAGICGNCDQESGFKHVCGGDTNSYFQMKTGQWNDFVSKATKKGLDTQDILVQYHYIEQQLESAFKTYVKDLSFEDYKKCTDIVTGMEGFMVAYERCISGQYTLQKVTGNYSTQYKYQDGDDRIKYSESIYKALTGSDPVVRDASGTNDTSSSGGSSGTADSQKEAMNRLMASGYYSEEQLSSYKKLAEIDIAGTYLDNTRRENLNQTYLEGLDNWERNVEYNKKDNGLISLLRKIVVGVGIVFVVWTLLIYIAYWFDRLNSLFYIDMLSILTFGKLHISDTESECTFSLKDGNKTDKKTVNHKAILTVCLICLSFGFLLITGSLFRIIGAFVDFVLRILGRVA